MNISTSVAIKSCHGIVELESNLKWNPFPTKLLDNVVCEKTAAFPPTKVFPAVNPVDKCTLKAAVEASIGGKKYCLNSLGKSTYSTAEAKCRSRNAKLPMPRSSQENADFMIILSIMGLNPDYDTGNPVILGMVDSVVGHAIGNYFALLFSSII